MSLHHLLSTSLLERPTISVLVANVGEAGIADNMLPGAAGEGVGDAGEADTADDDTAGMDGPPLAPLARHVRHVPRQSSAINLATRVGPAELKRMAAEVDALKAENRMLRQAAGAAAAAAGLIGDDDLAAAAAVMGGGGRVAALERQLAALRQQVGHRGDAGSTGRGQRVDGFWFVFINYL